jgi:hypothetical protein
MGKKELQEVIKHHEGFILSDGTLKTETLLAKACELFNVYGIETKLNEEIPMLFTELGTGSLVADVYYGAEIKEDKREEAEYIWNEDVYNLFSELSPNGYYFGSSEGDGACIGWFRLEEEN